MEVISVIVPVYKTEKYLDRCILSLLAQTYQGLEIILVDDGSPDRCPDLCDAWAERDPRIKVIHKENGGVSDARNAGLRAATGEYIGFVDSDDWIAPQMYEKLLYAIRQDHSDVASCGCVIVYEDERTDEPEPLVPRCVLDRNQAQAALLAQKELGVSVCDKLYRRKTIDGFYFEVGKYFEDRYWIYLAIGSAQRVSIVDYSGYFYLQRNGSLAHTDSIARYISVIDADCRWYEYLKIQFPHLAGEGLCGIWNGCIIRGQWALLYTSGDVQKGHLSYLTGVLKKYPIRYHDYAHRKATNRVWISLSRISLKGTCRLKNWMLGYKREPERNGMADHHA